MKTMLKPIVLACVLALGACTTAPKSEAGRTEVRTEADSSMAKASANDASLAKLMDGAKAVAVFPTVGKGAFVVGGAYGKGVLYEHGVMTGYSDITQVSVGAQAGGQSYTEIIVFRDQAALDQFKTGKLAFDAQATAVAIKSGAGANAKFNNGVAVFTMNEAGLMAEASVGGQRFSYLAK